MRRLPVHEAVACGSVHFDDAAAMLCLETLERGWFVHLEDGALAWWELRAAEDLNRKCPGAVHAIPATRPSRARQGGG